MNQRRLHKCDRSKHLLLAVLAALLVVPALGDDTNVPVIKIAPDTDLTAFKCNKCAITMATDAAGAPALSVKLQANQGFPGFTYTPPAPLDLSAATGVRAVVTNPNDAAISVTLKVLNTDPAAKEPWSTGAFTIGPGETRMVQTVFGQVYGNPGYKLDPKAITGINLYVGGAPAATERTLLIKAVETFTAVVVQPPPDPGKPPNAGLILWLDASKESTATLDATRHVSVLADRGDGHHDAKAASPDAMPTLTPNQMKTRPMLHFTGKEALTVDPIRTTPGDATVFIAWVRLTGPQTPGPNPTLISSMPSATAAPDAAPNFRIPAPPTGPKDSWRSSSTITVQNAPLGPLTIGQGFAGNIQEVLVYDHVFANETERQKVYDYLAKKWNADTPPLGWLRTDPLDPAPQRTHPDLPLSDQDNKGGWTLDPKFSDDFSATTIDLNRYVLSSSFHGWVGRRPGLFMPDHVSMSDGTLRLKIDKFTPEEAAAHPGWTYGTGYIRTKELTGYGYYEIEAKPAFSEFDCAFWLMDTGDAINKQYQDELDIFEMGIHSAKFANNDYMTAHVYNTAGDGFTWATGNWYHTPWNIADAYHTYGFEWTPTEIKWYVDGNLLRELKNTDWRYPMYLIFDAEPMLDWFGPIDDKDFPAEYDIKHLKVWRQAGAPAAATP